MKILPKAFWYATMLLLVSASCKKYCSDPSNPDCSNYDPCYNTREVRINFSVYEGAGGSRRCPSQTSCDTLNSFTAVFKAPAGNTESCTYEWQFGTDPTIWKGSEVVINLKDYLEAGNWEKHIEARLIIHRPYDNCLAKAEDTLVKVNRQIFFTQERLLLIPILDSFASYKGHFRNDPGKEVTLRFFKAKKFRTVGAGSSLGLLTLVTGYPFADTSWMDGSCSIPDGCGNYRFSTLRYQYPHCIYTDDLYYLEMYFYSATRLRLYRENKSKDGKITVYDFVGEKI